MSFDQSIRDRAHRTAVQLAEDAIAAANANRDRKALREQIAIDAGLPASMGSRLQGEDADALTTDAAQLARDLSVAASFDRSIRTRAGR